MRRQRCRCRRADLDVAGAPQVVHFPDPVNFDTTYLSKLSQRHRDGRVRIQGQVDPGDTAAKQCFFQLLHSDDFLMVPKLRKLVVAHRTPYIHGIHTNQYYTRFYEKVNFFLRKNPLFLTTISGLGMCKKSTARPGGYSAPKPGFHSQFPIYTKGQAWYNPKKKGGIFP